jgi:Uma2 family endonuclease
MSRLTKPRPPGEPGPPWEIATIFPNQGQWSEGDYLLLPTNHLVELSDGFVEVLPMPTMSHQRIVQFLSNLLLAFASAGRLGTVLFAPLRVRLWKDKYREPDIVFMLSAHAARMGEDHWEGADLVVEVVSEDDPDRDVVIKREEYARAGIPEYWIVDPRVARITVLPLDGEVYRVHGEHGRGERARSALLAGFEADVAAVFEAGKTPGG